MLFLCSSLYSQSIKAKKVYFEEQCKGLWVSLLEILTVDILKVTTV
jgi:hypothetical protein